MSRAILREIEGDSRGELIDFVSSSVGSHGKDADQNHLACQSEFCRNTSTVSEIPSQVATNNAVCQQTQRIRVRRDKPAQREHPNH